MAPLGFVLGNGSQVAGPASDTMTLLHVHSHHELHLGFFFSTLWPPLSGSKTEGLPCPHHPGPVLLTQVPV